MGSDESAGPDEFVKDAGTSSIPNLAAIFQVIYGRPGRRSANFVADLDRSQCRFASIVDDVGADFDAGYTIIRYRDVIFFSDIGREFRRT